MKLTRRQLLLAAIPAPLLLSACSDPKPQRDPVLPDQEAGMKYRQPRLTTLTCRQDTVFWMDSGGIYVRKRPGGWTKISEAL